MPLGGRTRSAPQAERDRRRGQVEAAHQIRHLHLVGRRLVRVPAVPASPPTASSDGVFVRVAADGVFVRVAAAS